MNMETSTVHSEIAPASSPAPRQPSPPAPNTPDAAPTTAVRDAHPGVRRVHTLPAKLAPNAGAGSANTQVAPDSVETLFIHPGVKIVSFHIPGLSATAFRRASVGVEGDGTLSWENPSERTLAVGQLRIYRVPSSGVSFLNSGAFLHPILKRSQCWLVDEESKFVLRGRDGLFYRVELPFSTDEEKTLVEEFKKVLGTVLQYEKTASPFRRGYVPEPVETPTVLVKKSTTPKKKAKKWRMNKVWEPEDPEHRAQWSPQNRQEEDPGSWRKHLRSRSAMVEASDSASSQTTEDEGTTTDESVASDQERVRPAQPQRTESVKEKAARLSEAAQMSETSRTAQLVTASAARREAETLPWPEAEELNQSTSVADATSAASDTSPYTLRTFTLPIRPRPDAIRSVTAPPQLHLDHDTEPGAPMEPLSRISSRESDTASVASSRDSFYSADEAALAAEAQEHVPDMIDYDEHSHHMSTIRAARSNHSRQISEITITPATPSRARHSEDGREMSNPSTPTLISDTEDEHELPFEDAVTPPDTIRLRKIRHATSNSSLGNDDDELAVQSLRSPGRFSSYAGSKAMSRRRSISTALIQKAYSLLVGPPSHLVSLMLDIAARIVRSMQSARDIGHKIPGAWNNADEIEEDEWEEDDFGIPLDNLRRETSRSSYSSGVGLRASVHRSRSRADSVASSDYDALIEGPMTTKEESRRSSGSLD